MDLQLFIKHPSICCCNAIYHIKAKNQRWSHGQRKASCLSDLVWSTVRFVIWFFGTFCLHCLIKKKKKSNQPNCRFPLRKTLIPGPWAAHSRVLRWAVSWLEQNSWREKAMLGLWPTVHCTQVIHIYYSCCNTDFRILINDIVRSWGHCLLLHLSLSNQNSSLNEKTIVFWVYQLLEDEDKTLKLKKGDCLKSSISLNI